MISASSLAGIMADRVQTLNEVLKQNLVYMHGEVLMLNSTQETLGAEHEDIHIH